MSNRRITVSTYETIIMQLKKGLSIRKIGRTKIAGRETIAKVKNLAYKNGWLEENVSCPSELVRPEECIKLNIDSDLMNKIC